MPTTEKQQLTQDEKQVLILNEIPFTSISFSKLCALLGNQDGITKDDILPLVNDLVIKKQIKMTMSKEMEFSRNWNEAIDEERKDLSRALPTHFSNETIFYPRFDSYVANVEDNFYADCICPIKKAYSAISNEYFSWHRNKKTNVTYPPKMHALNSNAVLACNLTAGLVKEDSTVEYAKEMNLIKPEPLKDHPEELNDPKILFDSVISNENTSVFLQTRFLEPFYAPFRQSMWAYQYGQRYLFDDEDKAYPFRCFAKTTNYIFYDGYQTFKSILAIYNDIILNPDKYTNKKITLLQVSFNLSKESNYKNLLNFYNDYDEEARRCAGEFSALCENLVMPEGTTLEFKYASLEEATSICCDNVKDYLTKRYLGF